MAASGFNQCIDLQYIQTYKNFCDEVSKNTSCGNLYSVILMFLEKDKICLHNIHLRNKK